MPLTVDAVRDLYANATLGSPDRAIGFVLWRVMHRYQRAAERALKPHDLTHLQFTTLAMVGWICRSGEPATQAEIARQSDIHAMQVSLMLKALDGKGLVHRPRSSEDSRTRRVEITTAGVRALRVAFPIVIELQKSMFGSAGMPNGSLLKALRGIEERITDE